jgi:acetylornithine aminotransferase
MKNILRTMGHDLILEDIVIAEGLYLFDSSGNKYADFESGIWCVPLGHNHPSVIKAIHDQSAQIIHNGYCYETPILDDAAREILSITEMPDGKCVFLCSGSEANEFGVKAIKSISDKPLLLTLHDSYLAAYGSAGNKSPDEWVIFNWEACASCERADKCSTECNYIADIPFKKIAGFVFEPGSSSGMVRFPPMVLIRTLAMLVKQNGGIVMANEVTTGIGRTGEWFGYRHYGLTPDIVAIGKGIGSGYPVSAAALSEMTAETLTASGFHYGQSHQNDPLGAAVALAVIRTIRGENLIDNCRSTGSILLAGLNAIREKLCIIADVRARGLMIAVDLENVPGMDTAGIVHRKLIRNGYIIARRPGLNTLRIDPPLITSPSQIKGFLHVFETVLNEVYHSDE